MNNIIIRAPFEATSGYRELIYGLFDAEDLFESKVHFFSTKSISDLSKHNIDSEIISRLKFDYQQPRPNIELFIHPIQINSEENNIFHKIPYSKNRLFFTMWETDQITDYWSYIMSTKCALIITPSQWNIDVFQESGITVPIKKCPLFHNNIYDYKEPEKRDKLIIGLCASVLDERKNILPFVEKFNANFQNNPNIELHLKVPKKLMMQIPKYVNQNFKVFADNYTYSEMMDWYHNIDILISTTKAEGWGLMQHEAMMCGRTVMGSHYGGLKEILNDQNSIPIQYNEEYPENIYFAYSNGRWSNPNLDDFVNKINWAYNNKDIVKQFGKKAHESVKNLTIKNTINTLNEIIQEYREYADLPSGNEKSNKRLSKGNKRTK